MPAAAKAKKKKVMSRAKRLKAKAKPKKKAVRVKVKMLGRVIHYYDKIGVAIIDVITPINIGDTVKFRHGEKEMDQVVMSMQIEHQPVAKAKKGDVIGMKVGAKLPDGTMVLPAK